MFFSLILLPLLPTSSPALEKSLSEGTEMAGAERYFHATCFVHSLSTKSMDRLSLECFSV